MGFRFFNRETNDRYSDSLNRRHKGDSAVLIYAGLLTLFGLVVIYSIGPARANVLNHIYGSNYGENYFFIKQLISITLAAIIFYITYRINYAFWLKHSQKLLILGLGLCVLLALAGFANASIAQCSLGACRWFDLGPLGTFQPAEFLKFAMVFFLAQFLALKISLGKINDKNETIIPLAVLLAIAGIIIIGIQKDMGTGISLISITISMLFISGLNNKIGLKALVGIIIFGIIFILISPHRLERVSTFFMGDNTSTSDANSYHIQHAKIALGSGGLSGVGIGNSVQATGYLPEAINDSVFAIIGEMFGFIGTSVLLIVLFGLLYRLIKIMNSLTEIRLKLIMAGIFGWLSAHVIMNIFSMLGLFPLTGITLPLLSFGGTSLIFISAIIGLVYQLSRYTTHNMTKEIGYENTDSRRGFRRSRHSSHRSYSRN